MPQYIGSGSLIQADGSNYSVDLSAGTEAIVACISIFRQMTASSLSGDTE
jgi:hypothetical protein